MSNATCRQCHAELAAGQWLCAVCGIPVEDDSDRTVQRGSVSGPIPPASQSSGGLITSVPGIGSLTGGASGSALPPPTGEPPSLGQGSVGPPVFVNPGGASSPNKEPQSWQQWLPRVAAALALFGVGVFVGRLTSDDESVAPTASVVVETTVVESSVAPTTVVETSLVETTVVETTVPATDPPATDPPVTDPPPPVWLPPSPPSPPVFLGPGAAFAVSEPLASGRPSSEAQPSLLFVQQVLDQLAANDWPTALSHFLYRPSGGGDTSLLPEEVQQEFALAERLSLLLIDAAPDPNGVAYDLRVGVVANIEFGTTSVVCGHLYVEVAPIAKVVQLGLFQVVSQGEGQFQPEDFLADPARIADLIAKCP